MANGETSALTPARIIGICITLSMAVNGISLAIITNYDEKVDDLAIRVVQKADLAELDRRTDQRYRVTDADRDLRLVNFRFSRNEQNIQRCLDFLESHRKGMEHDKGRQQ